MHNVKFVVTFYLNIHSEFDSSLQFLASKVVKGLSGYAKGTSKEFAQPQVNMNFYNAKVTAV